MAAHRNVAALMERDGAEIAGPKAAPVVGQGKFHLPDGGNAARGFVGGVIVPLVGQLSDGVQFLSGKGQRRRILHQQPLSVLLHHGAPGDMVLLLQLDAAGAGIGLFILRDLIEGGTGDRRIRKRLLQPAEIAGPPDIVHGGGVLPGGHPRGDLGQRMLPHAEAEQVGARFLQNGGAHGVIPVIVVGKAAQRGFQPADDDGDRAVRLADEPAIDDGRAVGAQPGPVAGGIGIPAAQAAGRGIVRHHRVDVAPGDQKAQPGTAEPLHILRGIKTGLGQDGDPIALGLQHPADDRHPEAGMIHIGIAGDIDKVRGLPAAGRHFFFCDGQITHGCSFGSFSPIRGRLQR